MRRYRVTWIINIEGGNINTHLDAARTALEIQRNPDSIATVFEVADDDRESPMRVDLADGSVVEVIA